LNPLVQIIIASHLACVTIIAKYLRCYVIAIPGAKTAQILAVLHVDVEADGSRLQYYIKFNLPGIWTPCLLNTRQVSATSVASVLLLMKWNPKKRKKKKK